MLIETYHRLLRQRIRWSGGRSSVRALRGRPVHAYEINGAGPGPTLVLLHGLGSTANSFANVLAGLRRSFARIWLPDLPGHGFSEVGPEESHLDVVGHSEIFGAFLDEVVREPAVLVGNSMGGALVLRAALERPRTPGVGLLSPAGAPLGDDGLQSIRSGFGATNAAETLAMVDRLLHRRPPGAWLVAKELQGVFNAPAVQRVLAATGPSEALSPAELAALEMPITFIWGASERLLPASGYEYYRSHLPEHAKVVLLESCGHLPMLEQPRRVVRLLEELGRAATEHQRRGRAA
jgi:pimeloyl-ACP methyl ester carboxylesterase